MAAAPKKKIQTFEKFQTDVKAGKIQPVYFFHALERASRGSASTTNAFNQYLLDRAIAMLQDAVVDGNQKDFNYNLFVAGESGIDKVVDIAITYPMMREKRLIVLKEANKLLSEDWRKLAEYLNDPAPTTCIIIVSPSPPAGNKGSEAAKLGLAKSATWVKFAPLKYPSEAKPLLQNELKARKRSMEPAAVDLLIDSIGTDLLELVGAVEHIMIYVGERERITLKDVEACIAVAPMETVWNLHDGLATRNIAKSLAALEQLTQNAKVGDYLFITGSLIRLVKDLFEMRLAIDEGRSPTGAGGARLSFPQKKKLEQARRLNSRQLVAMIRGLHECDRKMKSSRLSNRTILEKFVIDACRT